MGDTLDDMFNSILSAGTTITLDGKTLVPGADKIDPHAGAFCNSAMGLNSGTVVLPDAVVDQMGFARRTARCWSITRMGPMPRRSVPELADLSSTNGIGTGIGANISQDDGSNIGFWGELINRNEMIEQTDGMNGMISYLCIYIGFVLVIACAAIISIQQLSSVADSSRSVRVLSEVGCDRLGYRPFDSFAAGGALFLPAGVGLAHSLVALRVIISVVLLFGGFDIGGTVGLICVVFLFAYGGYFALTYGISKCIVRGAVRVRPHRIGHCRCRLVAKTCKSDKGCSLACARRASSLIVPEGLSEACTVGATGFDHDVVHVGLNRSQGEEEFLCDFLVVLAQYNELEDFRFAFGKLVLGGKELHLLIDMALKVGHIVFVGCLTQANREHAKGIADDEHGEVTGKDVLGDIAL